MKNKITEHIFKNYIRNKGKVVDKAIMGMMLKDHPELKSDIPKLMSQINDEIKRILALGEDKILDEIKKYDPDFDPNKKEEKKTKEMIKVPGLEKGKVITRLAPEPSKFNHFGHALSFLINYKYAKDYDGKAILRFEDTNPANATEEFVESMKEDLLNYIDLKPDEIVIVSDHMDKYYEMAEQLIEQGHAYMDFSSGDELKEQRANLIPSKYREKDSKTNMDEWKKFVAGEYEEGTCILRLKIQHDHKNEVMRDPVMFRMMKKTHWRHGDKYCVWPLYDFENAVEDGMMDITHVFRSNEFGNKRIELQDYIRSLFKLKNPLVIQYGRFNVKGGVSKGRDIREMIESGEYTGWDDPRLITLKALNRRGIQKESYRKLLADVGLSPTPTNLDFTVVSAINRQLLDPICPKYFYVDSPVEIEIGGAPQMEVKFDLFPNKKDASRVMNTHHKFLISKNDHDKLESGQVVRLIDTINFAVEGNAFKFHSDNFEAFKKEKSKGGKIHFVVPDQAIKVKMINEDASVTEGYIESGAKQLSEGDIIQAERFGFIKLEKKFDDHYQFIFCHN